MSPSTNIDLTPLKEFLSKHSHIHHATPSSPEFSSLSSVFIIDEKVQPLMVVRPSSAEDVAGLVSIFLSHSIPFTIRSGGHEMFRRSVDKNSVTLDMRGIAHVSVDKASLSARVGGGIITKDLAYRLAKEDFVTPTGVVGCGGVGYAGWASHGGYGIMSANYGLGVDQILGAKIVNGEGKIVDADETLLKGIRGGGGAFGVIVELTIKIYPLASALGGAIFYESENIAETIHQFNIGYQALAAEGFPSPLGLHQAVMDTHRGKTFALLFFWSSTDLKTGEIWLEKLRSLAPIYSHTVGQTTAAEWLDASPASIAANLFGTILTVSFKKLTPEVVGVFAKYAERMPSGDPNTMFNIHSLRGLPTESYPDSVFPERQPHFLTEILPIARSVEDQEISAKWANELKEALLQTDPENILPTRYISFIHPDKLDMREVFVNRYDTLVELKRRYDPQNVFKSALARF